MVFRLPCFVYTTTDKVSKNAAEFLISNFNFEKLDDTNKHFRKGEIDIIGVDSELPFADFLDIDTDFVIFLSRQASSKNILSFTVTCFGQLVKQHRSWRETKNSRNRFAKRHAFSID